MPDIGWIGLIVIGEGNNTRTVYTDGEDGSCSSNTTNCAVEVINEYYFSAFTETAVGIDV